MKRILVLALFVITAACSSNDDKKNSDVVPSEPRVDTTDYSECNRGTPINDIQGVWYNTMTENGIAIRQELEFFEGSMQLSNICSRNNNSTRASVTVPVEIYESLFSILGTDSDKKSFDDGNLKVTCHVGIQPVKVPYSFKGNCLVTKGQGSKDIIFIRSR